MFWQLSGDKTGADSLIGTAAGQFGTLDQTPNHISYVSVSTLFVGRELNWSFQIFEPQVGCLIPTRPCGRISYCSIWILSGYLQQRFIFIPVVGGGSSYGSRHRRPKRAAGVSSPSLKVHECSSIHIYHLR